MEQTAQTIINGVFAALGAAITFIVGIIWTGLRELQKADVQLNAEIAAVKLMMADSYIKKEDFDRLAAAIFVKLDKIDDKLNNKADR